MPAHSTEALVGSARAPARTGGGKAVVLFLAGWLALLAPTASGQSTQNQWTPELDAYVKLNSKVRLVGIAKRSTDGTTFNSYEVGPNLDVIFKAFRPLVRAGLRSNDDSKHHYVTFRVGYHYFINSTGPRESRVVLELTPRYSWPWSILMSDRNRSDLRIIQGKFSWRYRNRMTLERTVRIKSFSFTPYVRGEVYYDSRYEIWAKNYYSFGAVFPIRKRLEVEPNFEHDNISRSSPAHVNAVGVTLSLYF